MPYVPPSPEDAKIRLGQNPGVPEESIGHPKDLEEELLELTDDYGNSINWMFLEAPSDVKWCMLMENHPGRGELFKVIIGKWCPDDNMYRFDCESDQFDAIDWNYGTPEPTEGAQGYFRLMPSGTTDTGIVFVVISLDCESPGECGDEENELVDGECPE